MNIRKALRRNSEGAHNLQKPENGGGAKLRRNRGFTLVEVVVILAILAATAAISIPRLTGYLDKANEAEIRQNLATCVKAVQTWASERYADGVIGQDSLVYPDASAGAPAGSSVPVNPGTYETDSPTSATTWLGIVREYANLNLDITIWYITEVNFDDYNALTHLVLNRSDDGQAAVYEAEGRYADGGGYIGMPGGNPNTPGGGGDQSGTGGIPAKVYYTVVFDSQGGSPVIPQRVLPGNTVVQPNSPTKSNYLFKEWCIDAEGNIPYDFSSPVRREKLTLYAKWADIGEYFEFTIDTSLGDGQNTFSIGASGPPSSSASTRATFDWDIYVDDGEAVQYTRTSVGNNPINISAQLEKYGADGNIHTIIIAQHGKTTGENSFGWFRAFGNGWGNDKNRQKLATLVSPLPTIGMCISKNDDGTYNAGNNFAYRMFFECDGPSFTMGDDFNLPQNIATVGDSFCQHMFQVCAGESFEMNEIFNLPQDLTTVGKSFGSSLFSQCKGSLFTMNEVFNLPQGITTEGGGFASAMFTYCGGDAFAMNEVFNMPQGLTTVGEYLGASMFQFCTGDAFTMNEVFNMPQDLTTAEGYLGYQMFFGCEGSSFTMNEVFNLPQDLTTAGSRFCDLMFRNCKGSNFKVNSGFRFPGALTSNLAKTGDRSFYLMFGNVVNPQDVTASSIINGLPVPTDDRGTFETQNGAAVWSDYDSLPNNWK